MVHIPCYLISYKVEESIRVTLVHQQGPVLASNADMQRDRKSGPPEPCTSQVSLTCRNNILYLVLSSSTTRIYPMAKIRMCSK